MSTADKDSLLDESTEFTVVIDAERNVSALAAKDGKSIVLTVEDPGSIAIVQIPEEELGELIRELRNLYDGLADA